jgi:hypothetical protein
LIEKHALNFYKIFFSGRVCEHEGKSENLENCKVGNLRKVSGFYLWMALNSSELGTAHSEGPADPLLPDGHNNDHSTECLIYDQFINSVFTLKLDENKFDHYCSIIRYLFLFTQSQ